MLRGTDYVACINDHEIVACIGLLPGLTELAGIANRLRKVGQGSDVFAKAFAPAAGLAVYPLGGYRGEELIESARAHYRTQYVEIETVKPRLEKPSRRRIALQGEAGSELQYVTAEEAAPRRSRRSNSSLV